MTDYPPLRREVLVDADPAVAFEITRWEPPAAVAFTWHPGYEAERASHVEVTFTAAGKRTLVRLTHSGWEIFDDPAAARSEYDHGSLRGGRPYR